VSSEQCIYIATCEQLIRPIGYSPLTIDHSPLTNAKPVIL